jgi:hypothetical protein
MAPTFRTYRISGLLDALAAAPGGTSIIARRHDRLCRIDAAILTDAAPLATSDAVIDSDDPAVCPPVLRDVRAGWSIDPIGGRLVAPVGQQIHIAPIETDEAPQRIPAASGKAVTLDAVLGNDGRHVLWVQAEDNDIDMGHYHAVCVEMASGRVVHTGVAPSQLPQTAAWSAEAGAFLVFEPARETIWQVDPMTRRMPEPVQPEVREGMSIVAMMVHANGRYVALHVRDAANDAEWIRIGEVRNKAIQWDYGFALPEGSMRLLKWHPTERLIVGERGLRKRGSVVVMNARGSVINEWPLPRRWFSLDLTWSGDGRHIFLTSGNEIGVIEAGRGGAPRNDRDSSAPRV